jgi:hypothetical protein
VLTEGTVLHAVSHAATVPPGTDSRPSVPVPIGLGTARRVRIHFGLLAGSSFVVLLDG